MLMKKKSNNFKFWNGHQQQQQQLQKETAFSSWTHFSSLQLLLFIVLLLIITAITSEAATAPTTITTTSATTIIMTTHWTAETEKREEQQQLGQELMDEELLGTIAAASSGGEDSTIMQCFGKNDTDLTVCSGPERGYCNSTNQCVCEQGFTGNECQFIKCYQGDTSNVTSVCSNRGTCDSPDHCTCLIGYSGFDCSIPSCFGINATDVSTVCSGYGTCDEKDICTCDSQHTGNECQITFCYGIPSNESRVCSSHGACQPDTSLCLCDEGYTGDECELIKCFSYNSSNSNVCSGHGNCTAPNHCSCDEGYVGNECQLLTCFGVNVTDSGICSGVGTCTDVDTCVCNEGYTGLNCAFAICFNTSASSGRVCSGRGTCTNPNTCHCGSGFSGDNCQLIGECKDVFILIASTSTTNNTDVNNVTTTVKSTNLELVDLSCETTLFSIPMITVSDNNTSIVYDGKALYHIGSSSISKTDLGKRVLPLPAISQNIPVSVVVDQTLTKVKDSVMRLFQMGDVIQVIHIDLDTKLQTTRTIEGYSAISGYSSSRFITGSASNFYAMLKVSATSSIVIIEVDLDGINAPKVIYDISSEYSQIETLVYLDALYVVKQARAFKVTAEGLVDSFNLPAEATVVQKIEESTGSVYLLTELNDIVKLDTSLNEPYVRFVPETLKSHTDLVILGEWTPVFSSISPPYTPINELKTISLTGKNLVLGPYSTIRLHQDLNTNALFNLSTCSDFSVQGDACFSSDVIWPSSLTFANMSIQVEVLPTIIPSIEPQTRFVYYKNYMMQLYPSSGSHRGSIKVSAPFFDETEPIKCIMQHAERKKNIQHAETVATYLSSSTIQCPIPLFNDTQDEKIGLTIGMGSSGLVAYPHSLTYDYLDMKSVRYFATFDSQDSIDSQFTPASSIPFSAGVPQDLTVIGFDPKTSLSLMRFGSIFTTNAPQRRGIQSRSSFSILDQQAYAFFAIPSITAGSHYLELWLWESQFRYLSISLSSGANGAGSINIAYNLGYLQRTVKESCSFDRNVFYKLRFQLVRPITEKKRRINEGVSVDAADNWVLVAQLSNGETIACEIRHVPPMKASLFTPIVKSDNFTLIISQSNTDDISSRSLLNSNEVLNTTVLLDRVGVECQSGICIEGVPVYPEDDVKKKSLESKYIAAIVVSSVGFAIIVALLLVCIVGVSLYLCSSRKKKSHKGKKKRKKNTKKERDRRMEIVEAQFEDVELDV